jgi:hypothetical protein
MLPNSTETNGFHRSCGSFPLFIGLTLLLLPAEPARSVSLASYEPSETNLTLSSPDPGMTVSWPVQGGVGDVPDATEGSHVLKLEWVGEGDRKVEAKHEWDDQTFDLAGYSWILVDVFITSGSPLPGIVGIWDDLFGWVPGSPVPTVTNQWITVAMNVFHREDENLDHIWALLFENLAGDDGTIYLDNLRLLEPREISFAGYDWYVKSSGQPHGPGPNHFSEAEEDLWVDASGRLHMKIVERDGVWYCTEIVSIDSFGYGTYVFTVETRVDQLDPYIVLGAFTWDTDAPEHHYREIDFEFGRWRDPQNQNAQYVIQPWDSSGNLYRFDIGYPGSIETTTHVMTWATDRIDFTSYYGRFTTSPRAADVIASWSYTGDDIPPAGGENARINFWLVDGSPPTDGEDAEIVIADFGFRADYPGANCSDGFDNDGDSRVDFDPATFANPGDQTTPPGGDGDPGCGALTWSTESPECQDGIDNDGDGEMDHDAGLFAFGDADPAGPDPECVGRPWWNSEAPWSSYCGLGVELLILLPVLRLTWVHRRRSAPYTE